MTIRKIYQQAQADGYLTSIMEQEVTRLCQFVDKLSLDEYTALESLMEGLLTEQIAIAPRKHFINVMEEIVISVAARKAAGIDLKIDSVPDVDIVDIGDIAAYALNRLPPLYATTEEGAMHQRERAKAELQELIEQQVEEGLNRFLNRPSVPGEPLKQQKPRSVLSNLVPLLKSCASDYES